MRQVTDTRSGMLKEIASRSGVSVSTVGHILGNKAHMHSVATCKNVINIARELGYRPNSSAIAIGSGRFYCVTLLLSSESVRSRVSIRLLSGICDTLDSLNYHLNLARMTDERLEKEASLPKFMSQWMTDGVLVNYTDGIPSWLIEKIKSDQAPAIWINSRQEANCVHADDEQGGYEATKQLICLGHRQILYAVQDSAHYSALDRYVGYRRAMEEAGLRWRLENRSVEIEGWSVLAQEWLREKNRPTAILAYGDFPLCPIALGATNAGLRIPEDLSLVCFTGEPLIDYTTGMKFSTWLVPEYEVGRASVEVLMQKIDCKEEMLGPLAVPFTEFTSDTTAPPPSQT